MKKATGQTYGPYTNQTTLMADSLDEVIKFVLASKIYSDATSEEAKEAQLCAHQFRDKNPHLKLSFGSNFEKYQQESWQTRFDRCVKAIYEGEPNFNKQVAEAIEKLQGMALNIEPSLKFDNTFGMAEEGGAWSADAIASGEEKAFFQKNKENQDILKPGAGGGAYRILINTDHTYCQNPVVQAAAVCALAMIVQEKGPLEIWIQQGWLGNRPSDGITLFPVHMGGAISPQTVYFWIAHHEKDCTFSYLVNRVCGRRNYCTSKAAELPCDLYLYNVLMPNVDPNNWVKVAEWVASTARKMLFEEEDPKNFKGELITDMGQLAPEDPVNGMNEFGTLGAGDSTFGFTGPNDEGDEEENEV